MAQSAARRSEHRRQTAAPRLRLVSPTAARSNRRKSAAASAASARQLFTAFAIVAVVVAGLGMGRVWLTVQAAEASIKASELRDDIKQERYEGDLLEIQQSGLGSPSRIRSIATVAMDMVPADDVTYMEMQADAAHTPQVAEEESGFEGTVASMLDLAVGEAQVLLLGDVGLSSAR